MFSYPRWTWCAPWIVVVPSAASAARISEAPARRSPISTSAPWSGVRPVDRGVVAVGDVDPGAHPVELGEPLEAVLEDRLVDVRRAGRLGQQDGRRRLEVRREARIGRGLDVARPEPAGRAAALPSTSIRSPSQVTRRRRPGRGPRGTRSRWSHGAPVSVTWPPVTRAGDDERAGLDPVGDHVVLGAAQAALARRPRSCRA